MDIVDFFERQAEAYNQEQRCDQCYEFSSPMFEDALNEVDPEQPCCVQMMLTGFSVHTVRQYHPVTGLETGKVVDHNFVLYVVKGSRIDINSYNEKKGHSTNESKWETIWKPLQECFGESAVLDFCTILGRQIEVPKWSMDLVRNYQDANYDGWKITGIFREKVFN